MAQTVSHTVNECPLSMLSDGCLMMMQLTGWNGRQWKHSWNEMTDDLCKIGWTRCSLGDGLLWAKEPCIR